MYAASSSRVFAAETKDQPLPLAALTEFLQKFNSACEHSWHYRATCHPDPSGWQAV